MNLEPLIKAILAQYKLAPQGLHGLPHWERVLQNGLSLAEHTGADTTVVTLFAYFHDACRENEWKDPEHGVRGAALAQKLMGKLFFCSDSQMDLLARACSRHTGGTPEDDQDITVLTCWDADRLDLERVGKVINRERLCTSAAQRHVKNNTSVTD